MLYVGVYVVEEANSYDILVEFLEILFDGLLVFQEIVFMADDKKLGSFQFELSNIFHIYIFAD